MTISAVKVEVPVAIDVHITEDTLSVDLEDGRSIAVPLGWFPRLEHASSPERENWRLIGNGVGIRWEDIDEDISIEGIVAGRPSAESQISFKRWLQARQARQIVDGTEGRA